MHFSGGINRPPYEAAAVPRVYYEGILGGRCGRPVHRRRMRSERCPGKLNKGYSADDTREQCLRLNAAGIGHCDLLMLGTAGKGRGLECARASAKLENEIKPKKILINTMSAFVGTQLDEEIKTGAFIPASEKGNLEEEREFLAGLDLPDCYFWALHPLDSVKIDGILREEKQQMLDALTWSIEHVNESRINRSSRVGTL